MQIYINDLVTEMANDGQIISNHSKILPKMLKFIDI